MDGKVLRKATVYPGYGKTGIAGAVADTAVKATPGILHAIVINTAGAASSKIYLYDGPVSGTPYATIDGTDAGGPPLTYDAIHSASIHVKTVDSGGTLDITVLWV